MKGCIKMFYNGKEVKETLLTYARLKYLYFNYKFLSVYNNMTKDNKERFKSHLLILMRRYEDFVKNEYDRKVVYSCFSSFMTSDYWINDFVNYTVMKNALSRAEVFKIINDYRSVSFKYYEMSTNSDSIIGEFDYAFKLNSDGTVICTAFNSLDNNVRNVPVFKKKWKNLKELKHDKDFKHRYNSMIFLRRLQENRSYIISYKPKYEEDVPKAKAVNA